MLFRSGLIFVLPAIAYWDKLSKAFAILGKTASIIASVMAFLALKYAGIFDRAFEAISTYSTGLSTSRISEVQAANFSAIPMVGYVNAMFPLEEFIGLAVLYSSAWIFLILIRWTKSFIPTISN